LTSPPPPARPSPEREGLRDKKFQVLNGISDIANVELLNASHIIPWRVDSTNRLNPRNGICLNALHDRAFGC